MTGSWSPIDLRPYVTGEQPERTPALLARTDGQALLYPGTVHMVAAEPESGKSWLSLVAILEQLRAGHRAVLLDFEDTPGNTVARLLAIGGHPDDVINRLVYVRPDGPLDEAAEGNLDAILDLEPTLVILDGITDAMGTCGLDLGSNTDVATFLAQLVRPIAAAGPATVLLDHVVKSKESRGRYALGAQHKLAGVQVSLTLEVRQVFGRGRVGRSAIRVAKDRPGHLRGLARDGVDLGELVLDARDPDRVNASIEPVSSASRANYNRPTYLMARVSDLLASEPEGVTGRQIEARVTGKGEHIRHAVTVLLAEGHVEVVDGPRNAKVHRLVTPYVEADE